MEVAVVIANKFKQIMLVPKTKEEVAALKLFSLNDDISVEIKRGSFYEDHNSVMGYDVQNCKGDYLRAYESSDSVMLVLTPKKKDSKDDA